MKVLLIEDDSGDARLIRETMAGVTNFPLELAHAQRLADGLERLRKEPFDVVLLDLMLPDSRGVNTLISVREQAPDVPVIVWTGIDDEALALTAVRKGAHDYLVKGRASGASLVRCLRFAAERCKNLPDTGRSPQRRKSGKVLAFVGAKGGTGTTTVALNVAAALATQNKSTIAVELRPCYGTFSFQLNRTPSETLSGMIACGADGMNAEEVSSRLYSFPFGLRVLFGPQKPEEFLDIAPETAEALIQTIAQMADYCVIDLPSCPFPMSQAVIRQCHFVSVVVEREPMSLRAGKCWLEVLNSWGIGQNVTGVIIVNRVALTSAMAIRDMSAQLACPVVGVVPPAAELCVKANESGNPVVLSHPESVASVNLLGITERLSLDTVKAVAI